MSEEDDDSTLVYMSLVGYANWIETGDFCLSTLDAANMERPFKALNSDQMRRVLRLREIAAVVLRDAGSGKKLTR